ncbi:MAG: hypothetical protein LBP59_17100 [Planctomycetaceae bacterium]|nr:hypothetical protein [Planctomycetaceae bacterium]
MRNSQLREIKILIISPTPEHKKHRNKHDVRNRRNHKTQNFTRSHKQVQVGGFLNCSHFNLRFTFACLAFGRQALTLLNR